MAHKKPESLDHWTTFTKRIYKEWDADPGYYAIQHSELSHDQQLRFAIAWCTYYNLGTAAIASEKAGKRFWDYLREIYPTAQRATERRHFRGAAGLRALDQWSERWPKPESLARFMCMSTRTFFDVRKHGDQVAQYGPYFHWKWCDLHEVLGFGTVDMTDSEKHSPKVPQEGAELIFDSDTAANRHFQYAVSGGRAVGFRYALDHGCSKVEMMYAEIAGWGAANNVPPRTTDRRVFGLQEAETVCCVYKQMSNGSYTYGTRTAKAIRRLRSAGNCETALLMIETLLRLSPYNEKQLNMRLDALTE